MDYNIMIKAVDQTQRSIASVERGLASLDRKAAQVTGALRSVGGAIAAFATGNAIRGIIETTARFEDLKTTLASVTGSIKSGNQAFAAIEDFATRTQFGVEDLTTAYIKLAGAGIRPTEKLLRTFTDAAAISTDQVGSLQAITDLFSRNMQGGLGLEDLNRLADRGIPVFDILAQKLGINRLQVSELGKTAQGARKILDALGQGINERFGGATEARLDNLSTSMSNFWIAVRKAAYTIGQEMGPALKTALDDATKWLSVNEGLAKTIGQDLGGAIKVASSALKLIADNFALIRNVAVTLIGLKIASAFQVLASRIASAIAPAKTFSGIMSGMGKAIMNTVGKIPLVGGAIQTLLGLLARLGPALLNPWGAVAAAVIAAVTGGLWYFQDSMVEIGNTSASLKEVMVATWDLIKQAAIDAAKWVGNTFLDAWNAIVGWYSALPSNFGIPFDKIGSMARELTNGLINGFVITFEYIVGTAKNLPMFFMGAFKAIIMLANNMVDVVTARFGKLGEAMKLALSGEFTAAVKKAGEETGYTFTGAFADAFKDMPNLLPEVDIAGIMNTDRVGQAVNFAKEKFEQFRVTVETYLGKAARPFLDALEKQILKNRAQKQALEDANQALGAQKTTLDQVELSLNGATAATTGEDNALQKLIKSLKEAKTDLGLYEEAQTRVSDIAKTNGLNQLRLQKALDAAAIAARGGEMTLDEYYRTLLWGAQEEDRTAKQTLEVRGRLKDALDAGLISAKAYADLQAKLYPNDPEVYYNSVISGARSELELNNKNIVLRQRLNTELSQGVITAKEYKAIMDKLFPPTTPGEKIIANLKAQQDEIKSLTNSLSVYRDAAREAGVDEEEYRRQQQDRLEELGVKTRTVTQTIVDNFHKAGDSIALDFAKALAKGEGSLNSLKDVVNRVLDDILTAIIQKNITGPLIAQIQSAATAAMNSSGGMFGGGGGGGDFLGQLWNWGKGLLGFANGGTPPVNRPSIVGEQGPELFVPKSSGTVVPNHALNTGTGEAPVINFNINAISTKDGVQFLLENKPAIISMVTQGYNQRGRRGITS